MQQKALMEVGFYPSVERIDLHGRCLVQHVHGFHLLPARLEPVEQPYRFAFADVRESPLRRLANQWAIHVDHLECLPDRLALAASLRPPGKPLRKAWVRRVSLELSPQQAPLQQLHLGVPPHPRSTGPAH